MSSILKGLMRENGRRSVESVAREIVGYIGDDPSDSAIVDAVEGEAEINGLDPSELFDAVYDHFRPHVNENLHKWFKEKWVRFGPDGKIRGACARGDDSEGKPKCLPQSKAQNLGKKGRASAAARKRREDPNPERHGKAINVATKKKTNESSILQGISETKGLPMPGSYEQEYGPFKKKGGYRIMTITSEQEELKEKWSDKYKRSIDCSHPKGFSQRAHCQGRKKK